MTTPKKIIDPGHGGKDPGGGTNKHWKEKDKALEISLYQYERYKELGVPVAITRKDDRYLSPAERTKIVRDSGAEYCTSNHLNAGGGEGAEAIHSIYDDGKLAGTILDELKAAGQKIRRKFTRTLPSNSKRDYYFMNRDTGKVKTTIVEYGFADNAADTKRILENWKEYAEAEVKAFCKHIGHPYTAPGKAKKEEPKKETKPAEKTNEYKGNSIVDYLKSIGESSSKANRKKLAAEYGVSGYDFSAAKNLELLNKMRSGEKPKTPTAPKSNYKGGSVVDYLKSIGYDSSQANRKKLAKEYGVKNYDLSAAKNTELLKKMRGY